MKLHILYRLGQILFITPDFSKAQFICKPDRVRKKRAHKTKVLAWSRNNRIHCSLFFITWIRLVAFIFNYFHRKILQWGFCSLGSYLSIVWMPKVRCLSKEIFSYFRRIRLKLFRRMRLKYKILLKINFATDVLMTIWRKLSKQILWRTSTGHILLTQSCFNGWLMLRQIADVNFKWREMIEMALSLLAVKWISPFEL